MSLEDLRKQIDDLDTRIVELIAERQRVSQDIGKSKKAQKLLVEDRGRESKVIEHVKSLARGKNINDADVECIFRLMIAASKKIQGIEVAFQGEMGAYSEEAVFHFFGPAVQVRPRETLEEVFKIVETGDVPFGMVPIENSLEGSISRTYDLMLESALKVYGETEVRVIHCLIGTPEASLDTIKRVYSHPQALGQCRNFLKKLNYEMVPTYDTAGSVKMVKEKGTTDVAAIASARAAEIYGMKIIAQSIEDNPNNFTRFFVLSRNDAQPTGNDKTSIVFSAKDRPGALYECLTEFASRKINLTKLESRPTRQRPWEYNFYLDFDGHRQDKLASEALAGVEKNSIFLKVLGSYPKAK